MRPYKGLEDKRVVKGKRHTNGTAVLKAARKHLNRDVRRRSRAALFQVKVTEGEADQNNFLVGGEWFN